jgi:hypothetical protein
MTDMRNIGILSFVLGAMCAIAAAAKLPGDGQRVPGTWPVFVLGVGTSAVGLVLWHRHRRRPAAEAQPEGAPPEDDSAQRGVPASSLLRQLLQPLSELESALDQLHAATLVSRLDELNDCYVLPFVERRSELLEELGMAAGSELLVTAAYGERMLNRAWSAAADGYLDEARQNLRDALVAFQRTVQQLEQVERTQQ